MIESNRRKFSELCEKYLRTTANYQDCILMNTSDEELIDKLRLRLKSLEHFMLQTLQEAEGNEVDYYIDKLRSANIEISKLQAYNSACEDTLLNIELRFDQEIMRIKNGLEAWKKLDPNCDTACMEHHLLLLEKFRKEIFKNEMSSEE